VLGPAWLCPSVGNAHSERRECLRARCLPAAHTISALPPRAATAASARVDLTSYALITDTITPATKHEHVIVRPHQQHLQAEVDRQGDRLCAANRARRAALRRAEDLQDTRVCEAEEVLHHAFAAVSAADARAKAEHRAAALELRLKVRCSERAAPHCTSAVSPCLVAAAQSWRELYICAFAKLHVRTRPGIQYHTVLYWSML
jgi:hypothetical protein